MCCRGVPPAAACTSPGAALLCNLPGLHNESSYWNCHWAPRLRMGRTATFVLGCRSLLEQVFHSVIVRMCVPFVSSFLTSKESADASTCSALPNFVQESKHWTAHRPAAAPAAAGRSRSRSRSRSSATHPTRSRLHPTPPRVAHSFPVQPLPPPGLRYVQPLNFSERARAPSTHTTRSPPPPPRPFPKEPTPHTRHPTPANTHSTAAPSSPRPTPPAPPTSRRDTHRPPPHQPTCQKRDVPARKVD